MSGAEVNIYVDPLMLPPTDMNVPRSYTGLGDFNPRPVDAGGLDMGGSGIGDIGGDCCSGLGECFGSICSCLYEML